MHRWHLVVLLLILAAGLFAGLVKHGERHLTTYAHYRVESMRADALLLYYYSSVSDLVCTPGLPEEPCAFATERGFFARPGVSRLTALLGGIVLPPLLILTAAGVAMHRRWGEVPLLLLAAVFLAGVMLTVPGKYFSGTSAADIRQQMAARSIHVTRVDIGMSCLGHEPCPAEPWYAFARGIFATEGVPKSLAIVLGMIVPGLLVAGAFAVAFWRKMRKTPP